MTDPAGQPGAIEEPREPRRVRSLTGSAAVMASGTAVSRLLGFVRNALLLAAIGLNAGAANAFDLANKIPGVLFALLAAGVLNAVLVPQIVRALARPGGERTVNRILTIGTVAIASITVVVTAGAWVFVTALAGDWEPGLRALALAFSLWCIPQLFFYGMYTMIGQVLNAREQFGPYMWAPVLNNVVAIAGLGVYLAVFGPYVMGNDNAADWGFWRIATLAGTATLGVAAQAMILLWPLRSGGHRWRWAWSGPKGELAGIRQVAGWALAAVLLEQAGVLWATRIAAAAPAAGDFAADVAGNAAYTNALMIYLLPHSLVTVSLVTYMFTQLSKRASADDLPGVRAVLSHGLRTVGVFTVFAWAALVVLAPLAVQVILPTASAEARATVVPVVIALACGIVGLGAMVLVKQAYLALEDARSLFWIQIPMTATLVGVATAVQATTSYRWWVVGIGAAMAASYYVATLLRLSGLRRRLGGIDGRRIARTHALAVVAAVPAFAAGWALMLLAPDLTTMGRAAGFAVAAAISAGVGGAMAAVYLGLLELLRVREVRELAAPVLARVRRRVR